MEHLDYEDYLKVEIAIRNDTFWMTHILMLYREIKNKEAKVMLRNYLFYYAPIFCYEVVKIKHAEVNDGFGITAKELAIYRNEVLKYVPKKESRGIVATIKEMGVNFNEYVFDINLVKSNMEVIDFNFIYWQKEKQLENDDMLLILEGLILSPHRYFEKLEPNKFSIYQANTTSFFENQLVQLTSVPLQRMSYSTNRIFKNSSYKNEDKIYIMARIGHFRTLKLITYLFNKKPVFSFTSESLLTNIELSFSIYLIGVKAIAIEQIYNDFKEMPESIFFKQLGELNKGTINKDFYRLNRKARNNLHYGKQDFISNEELKIIETNQDIYINNFINTCCQQFFVKFGLRYKLGLGIAKISYIEKQH